MEFIQIQSSAKIQIQSYQHRKLTINGEMYAQSLVVTPDQLILDWPISTIQELSPENCALLKSLQPEVLLIGTGESLIFPAPGLLAWFREQRLGVECMDTAAACRTFQVLAAEQRKVIAALIV